MAFKRTTEVPGRNEPCPCGSGLKWKKCCGSKVQDAIAKKFRDNPGHNLIVKGTETKYVKKRDSRLRGNDGGYDD